MEAQRDSRQQEITLLQERSAGTFARVYLAEARGGDGLSRIIAVKVLKTQWSQEPELLNRTHDEARLLARLHHRNILRVEGLAEFNGQPAILMEFVDGVDLKQLIGKLGPVPPRAAYRIARDAAAALEAAYFRVPHGRDDPMRVVHRDIKLSNIMVSVEGEVKVLDFGTAHYQNEVRLAQTGALRFGSLKYMSPERRAGDRGEHTCDIYSLGVVLLEILLGEELPVLPLDPFEHDRQIEQQIARLSQLCLPNAEWEDSLRQTLARMCAATPASRLNAEQVAQLMQAFADQATGPSLDAFAASSVSRTTREVYGHIGQGSLSGSRIVVTLTSSGDWPGRDRSAAPAHPAPPPPERRPADPAPPLATGPTPDPGFDPRPSPEPRPKKPADAGQRRMVLLGAVAAVVGMLGVLALVAAGALLLYFFHDPGSPDPTPPDPEITGGPADGKGEEGEAEIADEDGGEDPEKGPGDGKGAPAGEEAVEVSVEASDTDAIQWIRLNHLDGKLALKADPTATESLPPGPYLLSVKVVARPTLSTEVQIKGPLKLTCAPAEDQRIRCAGESGDPTVILGP